jgi:hypothetical protein
VTGAQHPAVQRLRFFLSESRWDLDKVNDRRLELLLADPATATTAWADERLYYPVHTEPYTPARHFAKGKNDPAFRTKLAIGADLAIRAREAGFTRRDLVRPSRTRRPRPASAVLAPRNPGRPRLAVPLDHTAAWLGFVAGLKG